MPPQVSHVNSSKIKNGVVPRPPHRQHNRPPIRGSPGMTTVAPGGGTAPDGIARVRVLYCCIPGGGPVGEGYAPGIGGAGGGGGGARACGGLNAGSGRWNERPRWLRLRLRLWPAGPLPPPLHGLEARMDVNGLPKRSQHLRHGCDGS